MRKFMQITLSNIIKINLYTCIGVVNEVPTLTKGDTITSDATRESYTPVIAMPNANVHVAGIESADTMATLDSDAVHTLPGEKYHLKGSRLFNLQNLYNAIKTISEHSVKWEL